MGLISIAEEGIIVNFTHRKLLNLSELTRNINDVLNDIQVLEILKLRS
jgi:hypothetical protein